MNLLVVAATEGELKPFTDYLAHTSSPSKASVEVLFTGVGMVATTYALTKHLQSNGYDLVLQVGVGGSYDRNIALGDVVFITSEQFGDLGAEDHDKYLDIFEMGLLNKNSAPHSDGRLLTPLLPVHDKISLPRVSGLTVNTVSGNERTIKMRTEKYAGQVESMEGAAFHFVCLNENIPFAQVRAISNYVTPRDKSQWKMKEAVINLNNWLGEFIKNIS
jgi:futalosine hydrolase